MNHGDPHGEPNIYKINVLPTMEFVLLKFQQQDRHNINVAPLLIKAFFFWQINPENNDKKNCIIKNLITRGTMTKDHKMHYRLHSYINMQYIKINKNTYLTLKIRSRQVTLISFSFMNHYHGLIYIQGSQKVFKQMENFWKQVETSWHRDFLFITGNR